MNWAQFQAILWLRWRLSRNQFVRAGALNAVAAVLTAAMLVMGALVLTVAGLVGGWFAGAQAPPAVLLLVWDGVIFVFLVIWASGLMVELQRSESIDLPKLLHLPVTLAQVFVLNYAVSLLSPGLVMILPGLLGFCLGLTLGGGPWLVLTAPLLLSFIFLITAWSYCLRGWLAGLMVNKRKRRAIMVWVTIGFILVCQLPNFVFNSSFFRRLSQAGRQSSSSLFQEAGDLKVRSDVLRVHQVFPPGWVGYGAMALKTHNPWPALAATAAGCLLGAAGIRRAYRLTLRFYQGGEGSGERIARPTVAPELRVSRPAGRLLVERRLPGLPEEAAALTLATLRSLLRAPELKLALIMPVVVGGIALSASVSHAQMRMPVPWRGFLASGTAAFAAFFMMPTMANAFGLDRSGFRALVLLPVKRHYILLAKNLAFFPFSALSGVLLLVLVQRFVQFSWGALLMGVIQVPTAFLAFSLTCNLAAILAPFRLAPGSLQARKPKPLVFVANLLNMLATPLVLAPLAIPPLLQAWFDYTSWLPGLPAGPIAAVLVLAVLAALYYLLLPLEGRLLQRREQYILREVTEEAE